MFTEEDFVLDLNGHTLKVTDFYVSNGSLTINDTTKKGVIDSIAIQVIEEGTLTVNQMILEASGENSADLFLDDGTTAIINNGTIEHAIWNYGTLTIKNAKVGYISQNGTATIYDGEFTTLNVADLENNKTTLYGGTFNNEKNEYEAVVITSSKQVDIDTIQELVPDGYLAVYSSYIFGSEGSGNYGNVSIIKDMSDEIFNKIVPNGVWNTNTLAPTNYGNAEFLLSAIADDFDLPKGYKLIAYVIHQEIFDASKVNVVLYYNGSIVASKTVKATYTTPDKETLNAVNKILAEIDKSTEKKYDMEHSFKLDDLYLINYLNASSKGINESMALNFAKDLIELTNGGNIVYKYDARLGEYNPIGLWDYNGGSVIVYYNGKAVNTTSIGITISKVLYVPMDTANTDEARINAAMKRIKEYLGTTDGISIKVGGALESLNAEGMEWNEYDLFDETTSGNNYYIVTINGNEWV